VIVIVKLELTARRATSSVWATAFICTIDSNLVGLAVNHWLTFTFPIAAAVRSSKLHWVFGVATLWFWSWFTVWTADQSWTHWVVVDKALFLCYVVVWTFVLDAFASLIDRASVFIQVRFP